MGEEEEEEYGRVDLEGRRRRRRRSNQKGNLLEEEGGGMRMTGEGGGDDDYRKLPFYEESMTYCPACDEDQDAIMESVLSSKSDTCYHFIYERLDMPLYWRSKWKCHCMEDIGTLTTIQAIVTCPFTKHTSVNDYISFENCASDKICR